MTCFEVDADYIQQFDVQVVGGRVCEEYWVPAGQLEEFNDHIVGEITVTKFFYAESGDKE